MCVFNSASVTILTARMVFHMKTMMVKTPTRAVTITACQGQPNKVSPGRHSSGRREIIWVYIKANICRHGVRYTILAEDGEGGM